MVDAGGLNPPGAKALYGFDSHPGHKLLTQVRASSFVNLLGRLPCHQEPATLRDR